MTQPGIANLIELCAAVFTVEWFELMECDVTTVDARQEEIDVRWDERVEQRATLDAIEAAETHSADSNKAADLKAALAKIDEEIKVLIEETLRLHPEELPGFGWVPNTYTSKHKRLAYPLAA